LKLKFEISSYLGCTIRRHRAVHTWLRELFICHYGDKNIPLWRP